MRKLIITETSNSPKVILDPENNTYLISGESRPPNAWKFYNQIILWLDEFSTNLNVLNESNKHITFTLNYDYFNSSSAKMILDICKILAGLGSKGVDVDINWHFEKGDTDMHEVGMEISNIIKLPFKFVES